MGEIEAPESPYVCVAARSTVGKKNRREEPVLVDGGGQKLGNGLQRQVTMGPRYSSLVRNRDADEDIAVAVRPRLRLEEPRTRLGSPGRGVPAQLALDGKELPHDPVRQANGVM